jgi:putative DNA primase/helicase
MGEIDTSSLYVFDFLEPKPRRGASPAKPPKTPRPPKPTTDEAEGDLFHATTLAGLLRGRFRWATVRERWLEYDGGVWRPVAEERVRLVAAETLRARYVKGLLAAHDKDTVTRLTKYVRDSCNLARVTGALGFLKGADNFYTLPQAWDADAWVLNCRNGVLDLRTGELRPHSADNLLTRQCGASFDPAAETPRWTAHLERVLPNENVRRQVQRDLGRALVGAVLQESLALWYGTGANGKSTTARAILGVFGDYAIKGAPNLLVADKYERHPTEIADLCGSRLVFTSETDDGKRLAESLVKDLTGGDTKKARFMRGDFFSFAQTFDLVLLTNHKPRVLGCDDGIWRRIRLVPWEVRIPDEEQRGQDEIVGELLTESAGILNWLVAGLRDFLSDPHWVADEVRAATAAYREEQDALAGFLAERCELGARYQVAVGTLYEEYCEWCTQVSEEALSKRRFGDLLRQRGCNTKRGTGGERVWLGIRLVTHSDVCSN